MSRKAVTVTVAYQVVPGREADFHTWGWSALLTSAQQPVFLGGGVLVYGEGELHVVYRFDSEESARTWENSVVWAQWSARADGLAQETGRRSIVGSKAWFDSQSARAPTPAGPPGPPPKWKLWLVNSGAVFPPVFLFNQAILPYLNDLNPLFRTLLLCLTVAAIVTWILMPRLQRFLKKWLYPPLQALRGRHKRRTA